MLFSMMLVLAFASTLIEMMFAARFSIWRKNAHKFKWVNMTISIMLSFLLGLAFSAAGLVALGAALLSTILSIPGYAFLNWNYDTPIAHAQGGNRSKYYWSNFHLHWAKWRKVLGEFNQLMYSIFYAITFPVRIINKIFKFIKPYIDKYNNYVARKRASKTTVIP